MLGEVKMVVEKGHGREEKKLVADKCQRESWRVLSRGNIGGIKVKEEGRVMEE